MPSSIVPDHDCLILDACCVITLAATGRMAEIVTSFALPVAVATFVQTREALTLASADPAAPECESIELQPLVDVGLIQIVHLEEGDEHLTFLAFAQQIDDGEALTGAIAFHRNWAIATDDVHGGAVLAREAPHLPLLSTPDLVRHWVEQDCPSADAVRDVLTLIRVRARFVPGRQHLLAPWWRERS